MSSLDWTVICIGLHEIWMYTYLWSIKVWGKGDFLFLFYLKKKINNCVIASMDSAELDHNVYEN